MIFYDFHHHRQKSFGIYNLQTKQEIGEINFSVGIHPKDISEESFLDDFEWLKEKAQLKNCMAIGECGLDGLISVPESLQEKVFEMHISFANEIRKPLIIHNVRRNSEIIKFAKKAQVPLVIHGFNKNQNLADLFLQNGFYLSFGKAVLQNVSLQETVRKFPLEKLFLETDDKDFNIAELYLKVAEIKKISAEDLHENILQNLDKIIHL